MKLFIKDCNAKYKCNYNLVAHKKLHESGGLLKNVARHLDININHNYSENENNLVESYDVNSNINSNSNNDNLACGLCDIKFDSVFDLNIHIKSHFNGILFIYLLRFS